MSQDKQQDSEESTSTFCPCAKQDEQILQPNLCQIMVGHQISPFCPSNINWPYFLQKDVCCN